MQNFPVELLPAFCMFPRCVVAVRLTCWKFYHAMPSDTYKKTGPTEWSSNFWTVWATITPKITTFDVAQHRRWVNAVLQLPHAYGRTKVPIFGPIKFIWVCDRRPIQLTEYTGIHRLEPPGAIFRLVATFHGGRRDVVDIWRGLPMNFDGWDTIALFPTEIRFSDTTHTDAVVGQFNDMLQFAHSTVKCSLFRRS